MKNGWYFFIALVLLIIAGSVVSILTIFAEEVENSNNPIYPQENKDTSTPARAVSGSTTYTRNTNDIYEVAYYPSRGSSGGSNSAGIPVDEVEVTEEVNIPTVVTTTEDICEIKVIDCNENTYNYDGELMDLLL